jgi:hypothetical protein
MAHKNKGKNQKDAPSSYFLFVILLALGLLLNIVGCEQIESQFVDQEAPQFPPCRTVDERIYGKFALKSAETGESVSYEFRNDGSLLVEHNGRKGTGENCSEKSRFAFCDGGIFGRIVSNDCSFTDFKTDEMWYDTADLSDDGTTLLFTGSGNSYTRQ